MKRGQPFLVLFLLLFLLTGTSKAQDQAPLEGPPSEPPYTQGESEFATPTNEAPAVVEAPPVVPGKPTTGEPAVKYIEHPLSKKGLYRIDSDGSYHFVPNKHAKKTQSSTIRVGSLVPAPEITAANGITTYANIYGTSSPVVILYDYEWQPFDGFGLLGLQAGFGYFSATGKGRFSNGSEARETYTFHALPLNLGVIYRLEFMNKQWVAPYISGGGSYFALVETRDDGKAPHGVGTPAVYGGGGLMINIANLNKETGFRLDAEYGIADLWLTLEARRYQATNTDIDVSGTLLTLGVSADY